MLKNNYNNIIYKKRNFLTNTELQFYKILKNLEPEYNVIPQLIYGQFLKQNKKV